MKKRSLIITLTMTMAIGLGVTAYASTNSTQNTFKGAGLGRVTVMRGYDYVEKILEDKLGLTEQQITEGLNSGKTMYDLAKEKGMTEDQFKAALLEEKNKAVDDAVAAGKITKEEGETIKANLKNNIDNCTGTPGTRQGRMGIGKSQGRMMGNGARGTGSCLMNSNSE